MWPFGRRQPDSPREQFKAGTRAIERGELREGIELLEQVAEQEPDNVSAAVNLGAAYFTLGDQQAAAEQLERARQHAPDNPKVLLNLAAARSALDDLDGAIDLLLRILQIDPQYRDCHYNLGIAYWRKGRIPEAMAELEMELALHPDHELARQTAAQLRDRHGREGRNRQ